ncbi:MAG TPA: sigma factor-like helix-turn-helix DNA-binding protein [Candidatus Saccharibacteria bacterium]|nr:sigma factor-like helix-turn-helix DNA-binding protein [Candidatus Saccharibacteria bacterium]HMR38038.1 sigma factor-like helix-turn-helix DNA-binding protein [Candidatus Saccharibacteria bacterium]
MEQPADNNSSIVKQATDEVLKTIEQEREREIISRRFGLFDRKETLEQIGEMLGITRERVRQLEKAILIRIKLAAEKGDIAGLPEAEKLIVRDLSENGRVSRVDAAAERIVGAKLAKSLKSQIAFVAELSPKLTVVTENDDFYQAIGITEYGNDKDIKQHVEDIVKAIKKHGEPIHIEALHDSLSYEHPSHVAGLASVSKKLSTLKDVWGLNKWPTVNPKNIRDKIFVILAENGKPLHFSDIAARIKESDFKRRNVTTQAIHNELIKDKRFVLIGRGIYALESWGYTRGTVTDVIRSVLEEADEPLHRDEIVKRVLDKRQVKETTILLNLQSKPEFKRVAKATYAPMKPADK